MITDYEGIGEFEFSIKNETILEGALDIGPLEKEKLKTTIENEDDDWCLDDEGNRLPEKEIFRLSKWSIVSSGIRSKILNRFLNINTGEALVSVQQ